MRLGRLALAAILLIAFGLRVFHLGFQSIWTDEGMVVGLASRSLSDLIAVWNISPQEGYASLSRLGQDLVGLAVETDIHPPLYYLLIHFWMPLAGQSEFALRFPSVFFGLLTLPLLYVLGKNLAGRGVALVACAIGGLSPFYLDFSQQVRMYTMVTFLALLSIYSFHRAFQNGRRIYWITYVLSTSLALYTHYFAITVVVVQVLLAVAHLVVRREIRRFGVWAVSAVGAAILVAPWAPFALRQVVDYQNRSLLSPDWQMVLTSTWQTFNLGVTVDINQVAPVLIAILALFLVGLVMAWRNGLARPGLAVLLAYLVLPLLMGLAIFRFKPMFHPKYFMMASPAYYLLVGAGLYGFRRSLRWMALPAGLLLLVALVYGINSYYFDPRFWKDDTRSLGQYLDGTVTERDLVLSDLIEPLSYYYDGKAPAYYLPGDESTAPGRLTQLAAGRERVFLVHYGHSYTDPQGLIPFLLERASNTVSEKDFRGYTLREYDLRPGASFDLGTGGSGKSTVFENKLALEGIQVGGEGPPAAGGSPAVPSGGRLWAVLDWKLQAPADGDYKASLSLVDGRGHVAAQKDSPIMQGLDPTSRWLPGEQTRNYYILPVFPGVEPGEYRLRLTVYAQPSSGASGSSGQGERRLGDDLNLGKVLVGSPRLPTEFSPQDMGSQSHASLGPIEGLGYTINARQFKPGDNLPLTLFLRAVQPIQQDLRFRFELRDSQGVSQWQWESSPQYPTSKWQSGGGVRDWEDIPLPGRLPAGEYHLVMGLVPAPGAAQGSVWDLGALQIIDRPRVFTPPAISHPLKVEMGGEVALLGYDLEGEQRPGGTLKLTLYWQALKPMDQSYAVFVHLLDGQSHIWAQHDGTPGGDLPTSGWLEGEVVTDSHTLTIRSDAPPGDYVLEVGMYEPLSGKRLAVSTSDVQVVNQALWLQKLGIK